MNKLTTKERRIFNNLSRVHSPSVSLGEKIQEIISAIPSTQGSPINAVAAKDILSVTGVVVHGETVTINNPDSIATDVYEFLADDAQTPTDLTNIPVDISTFATKATGTLTVDTQPLAGDTLTIGLKPYTFVADGAEAVDGDISVGLDLAGARLAIVAAINGTDGINEAHPLVRAADFVVANCVITALVGGTLGNAIATTENFNALTNVFAANKLGTGTDCPAANAIAQLVSAITEFDTQGVTAAANGATVVLTAAVAGVLGNDIDALETMANGSFATPTLLGGVDGTVAPVGTVMVDASWFYVAIAKNTISDANWRRIAVGTVY